MFRKMVETFISGAIGLAALYVVAKVAYEAGHDMAEVERRFEEQYGSEECDSDKTEDDTELNGVAQETGEKAKRPTMPAKPSKLGMFLSIRKFFGKGPASVLGGLMSNPEDHQLEAYMQQGEVHINIKKRRSGNNQHAPTQQAGMA